MLKAVLFDLDDTLVVADNARVMAEYFDSVAACFSPTVAPELIKKQILASTLHIVNADDGWQLVVDRFADHFFSALGLRPDMSIFENYYVHEYGQLGRHARPARGAREAVQAAADLGLARILATNPVFPLSAIEHRLAWAGLEDVSWDMVTRIENMHYCKPQPSYYTEIAARIGVSPSACLMVGNDPANDLPAQQVGMRTFLVTGERPVVTKQEEEAAKRTAGATPDPLVQMDDFVSTEKVELVPEFEGTLADLPTLMHMLAQR